jgi:SAM-dependent methyltransferase
MTVPQDASDYFNANWIKYQKVLAANTLYHHEMGEALKKFLLTIHSPFSFVDIGCGDCSTIVPILKDQKIKSYIGIDAAADVLKLAIENTKVIPGEKKFICEDMITAIPSLPPSQDIIHSSYALHHLSQQEKFDFIQSCQKILKHGGHFIMIDVVLKETREDYLNALAERMRVTQQLSKEEVIERMEHPKAHDFPDSIKTFEEFAKKQNWQKFEVLVNIDIFAFMVFTK